MKRMRKRESKLVSKVKIVVKTFGEYKWETYGEARTKSENIAKALIENKMESHVQDEGKDIKIIGIFAKNSANWMLVDLACILSGLSSVTLYDTLGAESSAYIINQCELKTIFCETK